MVVHVGKADPGECCRILHAIARHHSTGTTSASRGTMHSWRTAWTSLLTCSDAGQTLQHVGPQRQCCAAGTGALHTLSPLPRTAEPAAHQVQVVAHAACAPSLQQRVESHQILLALWQAAQYMQAMVQHRQQATRRAAGSGAQHSSRKLPRIPAALPPCPAIQTRLGTSQRCQGAACGNCEHLHNLTMPLA